MNAYELADELNACFTKADWEYVDDCVNMLRQQADRIAELEKEVSDLKYEKSSGVYDPDPVAWMGIRRHGKTRVSVEKLDKDDIPLYTHPAKTLTDEEIEILASKHLCYQIEGSEVSGVFNFARAILRKAQEK